MKCIINSKINFLRLQYHLDDRYPQNGPIENYVGLFRRGSSRKGWGRVKGGLSQPKLPSGGQSQFSAESLRLYSQSQSDGSLSVRLFCERDTVTASSSSSETSFCDAKRSSTSMWHASSGHLKGWAWPCYVDHTASNILEPRWQHEIELHQAWSFELTLRIFWGCFRLSLQDCSSVLTCFH